MAASATSFDWQFDTLGDPSLVKVLAGVQRFATAFVAKEDAHWLSMLGASGTGKTHLARRLSEYWNTRSGVLYKYPSLEKPWQGQPAQFVPWREFVEELKSGNYSRIEKARKTYFCILDDIGAEYDPSGFAKAKLYELLDARLGKWTVITSNLSLRQLGDQDQRIASRLARGENKVINIDGVPDFSTRRQ